MKTSLIGIIVCFLVAGGSFSLHGQTNTNTNVEPPSPQAARGNPSISFLTPAQQDQYAAARAKALADNPDLKTEGESLIEQGATVMATGTADDKQAFVEKMDSHREKLRQAMLKEDPTLESTFAEIDKHLSDMKAKPQEPSGATNAPTASPASH